MGNIVSTYDYYLYEKKDKDEFKEENIVEYCMYSRGSFSICFSAKNYKITGAIIRTKDLAKVFYGVELWAKDVNGRKKQMWPIKSAVKNFKRS